MFFLAAPVGGLVLRNRPLWQRAAFALMCFMTINGLLQEGNWGLTVGSIETYRGHTKGWLLGHIVLTHHFYHIGQAFGVRALHGAANPW